MSLCTFSNANLSFAMQTFFNVFFLFNYYKTLYLIIMFVLTVVSGVVVYECMSAVTLVLED